MNDRRSTEELEAPSLDDRTIDRWASFTSPETERAFRLSTLARDRSLTVSAMLLAAFIIALFGFSDLNLFGDDPRFWQLLMLRASLLFLTVVAAFVIRTAPPDRYDLWTTGWVVGLAVGSMFIGQSRSPSYMTHFALDSMALLALYVVFITRLRWQIVLGVVYTVALVFLALAKQADFVSRLALIASVLSINLFGMLLAWRFHHLGRQQFATMQAELELRKALERLAFTDSLTRISNRRDFMAHAAGEFERYRRHRRTFSLLVLDLDHFKQINDRFGHDAGDDVLVRFGAMLKEQARTIDVPARLGGEEFALLLPETTIGQAEDVAARILKSTRLLFAEPGGKVLVTVSIGLTQVRGVDESIDEVITRADRALYQAKEKGRDRAVSAAA